MSAINLNTAGPARAAGGFGELIEADTPAMVVMSLRPGGHGDGSWLKNSNDGNCLMLDVEFTIDGGPHNKRKFWGMYVVQVDASGTDGQRQAVDISMSTLRAVVESARGILPGDDSPAAVQGRSLSTWGDLDGIRFPCRIGVEKGKPKERGSAERWPDKNILSIAITPDDVDYVNPGPQQTRAAGAQQGFAAQAKTGAAQASAAVSRPAWAA